MGIAVGRIEEERRYHLFMKRGKKRSAEELLRLRVRLV
jgi:hypothetical protein